LPSVSLYYVLYRYYAILYRRHEIE
jgi:hypothetical protein